MAFFHSLSERTEKIKLVAYNIRRGSGVRNDYTETDGELTLKRGAVKYLKQIELLHLELFRFPLFPWLSWIYRFRARDLVSVVVDKNDQVVAYDLFFFEPSEANEKFIHEIYVGVKYEYQDKGLGVKLRMYSSKCYDNGYLDGISTLAAHDNIKALRTAQKAGFGIVKESVKPRAMYLVKRLTRRF
ncbi:MAG: GNAT family N-acetyltransferase [Succinivibrio sp.]